MPLITALEPVIKCQGYYTDCPPQKITIGIWVSIAKEPIYAI